MTAITLADYEEVKGMLLNHRFKIAWEDDASCKTRMETTQGTGVMVRIEEDNSVVLALPPSELAEGRSPGHRSQAVLAEASSILTGRGLTCTPVGDYAYTVCRRNFFESMLQGL
jgi:hypothetical protein